MDQTIKMPQEIFQQLTLHLRGGQTVQVQFRAEQLNKLNPQIDAFLKAFGEEDKRDKNFFFQGSRVVVLRIADVSAAEVVSLVRKPNANAQAPAS